MYKKTGKAGALFTFAGKISVWREASDDDDHDEGIAPAISEERSIVRWGLSPDRKLTEKVNKAKIGRRKMVYLVFHMENQTYAIEASYVKSVIQAAALIPLSHRSEECIGLLNFHGELIPVISLSKLLGISAREVRPSDQIAICRLREALFALLVDRALEVRQICELISENPIDEQASIVEKIATDESGKTLYLIDLNKVTPLITAQRGH